MERICGHCGTAAGALNRHCFSCAALLPPPEPREERRLSAAELTEQQREELLAAIRAHRLAAEAAPSGLACRTCKRDLTPEEAFEPRLRSARAPLPDLWEGKRVLDRGEGRHDVTDAFARRWVRAWDALQTHPLAQAGEIGMALLKPCPGCGAGDPLGVGRSLGDLRQL